MADLLQPLTRPLLQSAVLAANSKESPAQLSGGSGGGGYDDSWAPALGEGQIMLFADFLTPFFGDGEAQGEASVPIDSDPGVGVTYDSDHIQDNFGYVTEGSGEGWILKPAAFALIDPEDFCIILQTNNGPDVEQAGAGELAFCDESQNVYYSGVFTPKRIEDYNGDVDAVATTRPALSVHRYAATFRIANNIVAIDGVVSDVIAGPLDMTGADRAGLLYLNASGENSPIEYFAVISPSLTDEQIEDWTGDLPALAYDNAATCDLDFRGGSYTAGGSPVVVGDLIDWKATDPGVLVPGEGIVGSFEVAVDIGIKHETVRATMRDNFTLLMDWECNDTLTSLAFSAPQGTGALQVDLANQRVSDTVTDIAVTNPGTGRHKLAFRLVGAAGTVYVDGSEVGTGNLVHEYQTPQDLQISISGNEGDLTLRRIYITAPVDDATMASLTTVP